MNTTLFVKILYYLTNGREATTQQIQNMETEINIAKGDESLTLSIAEGGTGATTASHARTALGVVSNDATGIVGATPVTKTVIITPQGLQDIIDGNVSEPVEHNSTHYIVKT